MNSKKQMSELAHQTPTVVSLAIPSPSLAAAAADNEEELGGPLPPNSGAPLNTTRSTVAPSSRDSVGGHGSSSFSGDASRAEGSLASGLGGGGGGFPLPRTITATYLNAAVLSSQNEGDDAEDNDGDRKGADLSSRPTVVGEPPVGVSAIPHTPVTVTPSLGANPKALAPLPVRAAARLTNPTMERLAKEAAAKEFRAAILKARVPAPNIIASDEPTSSLSPATNNTSSSTAAAVRGGSDAFNAVVSATSGAPTSPQIASDAVVATSSPTRRRKGKGIVTVLNGLRHSLTAAGVLLFAAYTPAMLQAVPSARLAASSPRGRKGPSRRKAKGSHRAASSSSSASSASEQQHQGHTNREAVGGLNAEDPVDDLMPIGPSDGEDKKGRRAVAKKGKKTKKSSSNVYTVTSSASAPAIGTSRLAPLLKAVRLQQSLLCQDLPLGILHADDGIDLAWVQRFIVDGVVYPIYQGAQLAMAQQQQGGVDGQASSRALLLLTEGRTSPAAAAVPSAVAVADDCAAAAIQQNLPPSPYPLLDSLLQRGATVPIAFDRDAGGADIPLAVLQRAAAGDPIVLAEDAAGFDDMGESTTYGKRNLSDFLTWRVRTVGRWAAVARARGAGDLLVAGGVSAAAAAMIPRRIVFGGEEGGATVDNSDFSVATPKDRRRRRSHGHGPTLVPNGEGAAGEEEKDEEGACQQQKGRAALRLDVEAAAAEDDDEDHFGVIDSPRSALVCYRHGLRVSSWYELPAPEGGAPVGCLCSEC